MGEFEVALSKLQGEITTVKTNKTADMGKFKIPYASYDHVLDHVRPHLAKHGFAVTNCARYTGDGTLVLDVKLVHISGVQSVSTLPLKSAGNPQALGSELSYMKRYGLGLVLSLAFEDEDDDGGRAGEQASTTKPAPRQRKPAPPESDETTKRQRRLWAQVNATAKALGLDKSGGEAMLRGMLADMFEKESTKTLTTDEDYELRHSLWEKQLAEVSIEEDEFEELRKREPKRPRQEE